MRNSRFESAADFVFTACRPVDFCNLSERGMSSSGDMLSGGGRLRQVFHEVLLDAPNRQVRSTPYHRTSSAWRGAPVSAKRRPFKTRSPLCQSGSVQELQAKVPRIGGTTSSTSHLSPQPRQYSRNPSTSDRLQTKKMLREPRHSRHPNSSGADDAHSGGIRSPH